MQILEGLAAIKDDRREDIVYVIILILNEAIGKGL